MFCDPGSLVRETLEERREPHVGLRQADQSCQLVKQDPQEDEIIQSTIFCQWYGRWAGVVLDTWWWGGTAG